MVVLVLGSGPSVFQAQANGPEEASTWPSAGQNLDNTRANPAEETISPANASRLTVKWVFQTAGDVSATPAVDRHHVYFPDWGGMLYSLDRETGQPEWTHSVGEYTGVRDSLSRSTPLIAGNKLILGTQLDSSQQGARVFAVDKRTGNLLWMTTVDDHPAAIITQSAIGHGGRIYVGVSSAEEFEAAAPGYPCCSFRGSVLALKLSDGSVLWKTYVTPAGKGFSGVAVWGSTPVLDAKRHTLFIGTGNNYTVPQAVLDCVNAGGTPDQVRACIESVDGSADNHFDSLLALDMDTGAIKWANNVLPYDAWTIACLFPGNTNCAPPAGVDFDFGQGPALFRVPAEGDGHRPALHGPGTRELLGAGQKSGYYWAFDPDTGNVVWATQVGPGGLLGGLEFGSAVDEHHIYVAECNTDFQPVTFTVGPQAGRTVKGGFWCALDPATGQVLWQVAGNKPPASSGPTTPPDAIALAPGPLSVANGVVFAGTLDAEGTMYALDGRTGNILWSFASGGSINSGPAIVDGVVYWGSGYHRFGGTPNNKFYAFSVNGEDTHAPVPLASGPVPAGAAAP
jgi:polyvinyl alcohol dehydrogenase (cytochrome)